MFQQNIVLVNFNVRFGLTVYVGHTLFVLLP